MTGSPRSHSCRTLAALVAPLAIALATGLAFFATTAAPASAGTPCSQKVINDWFDDGKVDHKYSKHCYTEAIQHLPRDIHTYSNAEDDIRAAMLAAFQDKGNGAPPSDSTSQNSHSSGEESTPKKSEPYAGTTPAAPKAEEPKRGVIVKAIEWLGPSNAGAVPLPLLALAAQRSAIHALIAGFAASATGSELAPVLTIVKEA